MSSGGRTILFAGGGTGGHLYPGLAIARAVVRADASMQPFFVGALRGIEKSVLPSTEFPHLLLDLHPLYRSKPWENWKTLAGALSGWRRLGEVVRERNPALIVGTGGYAAGLAQAFGAMHGISIVQQAGDSHPGLTARMFRRWTREYYLAFPEAAAIIGGPADRFIDTGAPIEPPPTIRPDRAAARRAWNLPESGQVVLIYGGSQGSLAINQVVASWLAKGLPENLSVIWGTGKATFGQFSSLEAPRVRVREYLAPIADAYAASDFAIARAGAMTTAELFAWGIPGILVPLPTAAADHQTANARALDAASAALHIPQREFTVERLDDTVNRLLANPDEMGRLRAGALARARPDAAQRIAARVIDLAKGRSA